MGGYRKQERAYYLVRVHTVCVRVHVCVCVHVQLSLSSTIPLYNITHMPNNRVCPSIICTQVKPHSNPFVVETH